MRFHIFLSKVVLWQIQPESPLWWLESSETRERTSKDLIFCLGIITNIKGMFSILDSIGVCPHLLYLPISWGECPQIMLMFSRSTDCVTEKWVLDSVQFHVVSPIHRHHPAQRCTLNLYPICVLNMSLSPRWCPSQTIHFSWRELPLVLTDNLTQTFKHQRKFTRN